jgi:hypothetical protein
MSEWTLDSSAIRRAHELEALPLLCPPTRVRLSPLTFRGSPDALYGRVLEPEFCYPDPDHPGSCPPDMAAVCDQLEALRTAGVVVLDDESADGDAIDSPDPTRILKLGRAWKPAGLLGPVLDETLAAIIVAENANLPLVCHDPDVDSLAQYWGLTTVTVEQFTVAIAA